MKPVLVTYSMSQITSRLPRPVYKKLWFYFCLLVKEDKEIKKIIKSMMPSTKEVSQFNSPLIESFTKHRIVNEDGSVVLFS